MRSEQPMIPPLAPYRRRFRVAAAAAAVVAASAAAGLVLLASAALGATPTQSRVAAILTFLGCAAALGGWLWRRWTVRRVAAALEARQPGLDNLVITAAEIAGARKPQIHPLIAAEVERAALLRLQQVPAADVQPLALPLGVAAACLAAVMTLAAAWPPVRTRAEGMPQAAPATEETVLLASGDVRVVVTPPPYARDKEQALMNPAAVAALQGSSIRLEASGDTAVALVHLDGSTQPFQEDGTARFLEFAAAESRPLLIRFGEPGGSVADRLIHLRVQPDAAPAVRIRAPAEDLILPDGSGEVRVDIAARDDVGLASVILRYTRVSGAGETFTFDEGEVPLQISRTSHREWTASGTLSLPALALQEGDSVVYRAVARDARPGADPVQSDSFLIEIGRLAGLASTGFAVPEERDRHAISQQMLIIKTERLQAARGKMTADQVAEQARLLAVEQRMVKAEFVFMTGGVVEDEMEEAAHSHELAEGRFENTGQMELLAAIREMSRAEARLNAVEIPQALAFERAALAALQRAFDRRRYLLRTLPERTRIDVTRRLSGELAAARSSARPAGGPAPDLFVERAREVLEQLRSATTVDTAALVASRALALAPASEPLQRAAIALAAARDAAAVERAARDAEREIVNLLGARMASSVALGLRRDPLAGRVVQELPGGGRPR